MINLPRQLIYQDRHVLEDYTAGNELNQALYDALRSIKHPSLLQRWKGAPALSDDDILRIFNDAYYLCMVMSNDERYILHNSRFREQVSSVYAWQVALVILSLQKHLTQNAEKHLYLYKCRYEITEPFLHVLDSFRKRGSTFWMNFHLQLPNVYTLEIDWEVATRGFNVDIIKGILRLWSDVRDRLSVCRKIYNELVISPRRDMPQYSMSYLFLKRMITIWERAIQYNFYRHWNQYLHSDTQKETKQEELLDEEPSLDSTSDTEEAYTFDVATESKGKSIFVDVLNNEDLSRRREETSRFMRFIRKQQWGDTVLDCKQDNVVCLAFVAFCREWHTRGWVLEKPNRGGCYRFLCDDCGFKLAVNERTFQTHIAKMLTHEYEIEDKLKEITPLVAAMF